MKNKSIVIKVEDSSFDPLTSITAFSKEGPFIYNRDCQHIINNLNRDTDITNDELNHALDIVTAYFVEHCINGLVLDINERNKILAQADIVTAYFVEHCINGLVLDIKERNKILAPAKEMTIDEIEKELGYKIKIVKEKEEKDD